MGFKIIIITSEAFPNGMAGTNRIISLAKGFISNGVQCEVISFYKYAISGADTPNPTAGNFDGVKFRNVFSSPFKSPHLAVRQFHEFAKPILVLLAGLKSVGRRNVVIYYAEKTWPAVSLKIITSLRRAIMLREETEHPEIRTVGKGEIGKFLYKYLHYRLFDGLLVITQNLADYFRETLDYRKPILIVPMLVDIERFSEVSGEDSQSIVFSGELDDRKEGVTIIIKAFSLISNRYPDLKLDLFGTAPDKSQESSFFSLVQTLKLAHRVTFHGYKDHTFMTGVLCKARMFVFSRPPSLQAHFGFSTKLGEYLATGKPVIVSQVGEISRYLRDNIDAYVCQPDPESISGKIIEIQENYPRALEIGSGGRETATLCFNNKIESAKILEFLKATFDLKISLNDH